MKKPWIFSLMTGIAIASPLAARAAAPVGTEVEFKYKGDRFYLSIVQHYAPGVTVEQVRGLYASETLLPGVSNLITAVSRIPQVVPGHFELETTATKFHLDQTTVNVCSETLSATQWRQDCRLDPNNGTNRRFFNNAEGSNSSVCTSSGGQVTCQHQINGRPKAVHLVLFNRSPEQLAAAGAVETVHDMSSMMAYGNTPGLSPFQARSQYESTDMPGLMQRLYDDVVAQGAPDQLGSRVLDVKVSSTDGTINLETRDNL